MAVSTLTLPEELKLPKTTHIGSAPPDLDDVLAQIDGTLDLIAQAQSPIESNDACETIDISIIVPCHNCRESLPEVLERIEEVMPRSCEVIVIDDASTDGSWHYVRGLGESKYRKILHRRRAHGRGSAIRLGIRHSQGRVVAIQDADMAYDPADLLATIWPVLECEADAVFGSRRLRKESRRGLSLRARLYGRVTTLLANLTTGLRLSDLESSHKAFRGDLIRSVALSETDAGFDAEVAAKVARAADVVMEVPTRYEGCLQDEINAPSLSRFCQTVKTLVQNLRR